ncbi:hypothetical protein VH571_02570 [Frondihabitans sp. 4ASC-45]|uniref:hypothetical protein n=1 Tax=Frondihabitans sp. 4ASC-45 TaxID=3111636 RepID=UPI003C1C62C4
MTEVCDCAEEFGGFVIVDELDYKARIEWDATESTRVSPEPDDWNRVLTFSDRVDGGSRKIGPRSLLTRRDT